MTVVKACFFSYVITDWVVSKMHVLECSCGVGDTSVTFLHRSRRTQWMECTGIRKGSILCIRTCSTGLVPSRDMAWRRLQHLAG